MGHLNATLSNGYQPYFSFATGLQSEANIASTTLEQIPVPGYISGYRYTVTFTNNSRVEIDLPTKNDVLHPFADPDHPGWNELQFYHFTTNGSGFHILDDGVISLARTSPSDPGTQVEGELGALRVYTPGNALVVEASAFGAWTGNVFAANFLSTWLAQNNTIDGSNVTGDQVIQSYGGDDTLRGGSGNDRIADMGGETIMYGGVEGQATGNDTFVFGANAVIPGTGQRRVTVCGTDDISILADAPQAGEVNTVEAQGNNDFTPAEFAYINRIAFNGATALQFGAAAFNTDNKHIAHNSTIVGDSGANALDVWCVPADIAPGHADDLRNPDADLSQLAFQHWTAGQDTVTIHADMHGLAGLHTIVAPDVATTIIGGDNGEILTGGSANDTIIGGGRDDIIDGGAGTDTARWSGARSDYKITQIDATTVKIEDLRGGSPDGTDTVKNVELFHFAGGNQTYTFQQVTVVPQLNATDADDHLVVTGGQTVQGLRGNDTITGFANLNVAFGDDDNDLIYIDGTQNQLFGGNGHDWLGINGDNNALVGGAGNEVWMGATGNSNTLAGGDGQDSLYANGINNWLFGEGDTDWLGCSGSQNQLLGGAGNEWMGASGSANALAGGEGDDTLFSNGSNVMFGESGNDWLGCSGNGNYMAAGAGNDYVAATGNTNLLDGGAGNDTLLAAAGHQGDTFVFHAGYGQDDITGFARHGAGGTDVIDMKGFGLTFASLMNSYATDTANGVLIALDGATSLTIHDVTKAQLAASDFLLA